MSDLELKLKEEFMVKFLTKCNETLDINEKDKNRLAEENTYKSSHLYITINFGIIAASSFVFSGKRDLSGISQFLSIFLICSVFSIIFEVLYRKNVLKSNIQLCDERLNKVEKIQKKFMGELLNNLKKPMIEYGKIVNAYNDEHQRTLDVIDQKRKELDKKVTWMRQWAYRLLITSIFSLTFVLIIESGFVNLIRCLLQH